MNQHPGIRDIQELRLAVLFEGLLKDNKAAGTARILGVHRASIHRSIRDHHLVPVVKQKLEEYLVSNERAAASEPGEMAKDDLAALVEELRQENAALKRELERKEQEWERRERALRAAALNTTQGPAEAPPQPPPPPPAPQVPPTPNGTPLPEVPMVVEAPRPGPAQPPTPEPAYWRYPSLVTPDPLPGGAAVYGAAEPLVREWWLVKEVRGKAVTQLDLAATEERQMELEMLLIEEHNLTLPRARRPYDDFQRHREIGLRQRALQRARGARREAQRNRKIMRFISLGLFRPPPPIWPPVTPGAAGPASTEVPGHPTE